MEHKKKLRKHEFLIGVNEKTASGNIWFQNLESKKKTSKIELKKKRKGASTILLCLKTTVMKYLFFHHLFMEHAFLVRATGFILALKSCLFDRFFRRLFAKESKKKSLCWRVSWAKKNVCRLLTPNNEKVKKKWLYLSFWRRHVVILVNVLWRKVVVFLLTSLCFLCFCCWKDNT